jgi:hypothetical protein
MFKEKISRRDFLGLCAATASSSLFLTACSGLFSAGQAPVKPEDYYRVKREAILKDIDSILGHFQKASADKFGAELSQKLVGETRARFEQQLPDLPYIGGEQNELTVNLYQASAALAFYRVMQANQKTLEETGEILYRAMQSMMQADTLAGVMGWLANSSLAQNKLRDDAATSQKRTYPEDWVFEFVSGEGQDFDFGINYLECGICKYYRSQGAEELTPYLCLMDFPVSEVMKTGLVRTTTLAKGGTCCDFRFKNGRACQMEWTPGFLDK